MESTKNENIQSRSLGGAKINFSSSPFSDFFNQNPNFLPQYLYHNHPDSHSIIGNSSPLINNPFAAAASSSIPISKQKNPRKRNRPSRRAPTTVLMTDVTNFRQMVQVYTGIPTSSSAYSHSFDLLGAAIQPPVDNLSLLFSSPRPPPPTNTMMIRDDDPSAAIFTTTATTNTMNNMSNGLLQLGRQENGGIRFPVVGFGDSFPSWVSSPPD